MAADLNKECYDYAREHFKDLERTAYRVPDVLFPREGQTGDVLNQDELRSGLHAKFADKKHKNVSIKKLLEERHALSPVEIIAKRLYNRGTTFKESMFVLCNYHHANYFEHVPSRKSESDGEYDIIAMGSFGFVFIQVKAFSLPTITSIAESKQGVDSSGVEVIKRREHGESNRGRWGTEHIRKAVEQLIDDRKEFLETNRDLPFVEFSSMHFVVGIPDVESVHDKAVREVIEDKLDSYDGGAKKIEKRMKVLTIYKDTVASQENFHEWFKSCILSTCETRRLFYDDLYTIVGRYTCPKYSKVSRLGIPGLGTKRSSTLITLYRLTDDQQKLLHDNARRQIIAGGFGTGKTLLLIEEAISLVIGQKVDNKERNTKQRNGGKRKGKAQARESGIVSNNGTDRHPETNINGSSTEMDHTRECEAQAQHKEVSSESLIKDHVKPSFCFILSCSNVGENGFVFNDPDILVEQLENHLRERIKVRRNKQIKDQIEIYKLDEVIQRSFPEEKGSESNIACEMFSVDILTRVIHDLVESKPGYTCHFMLDEFPSINLVSAFEWRKLQKLHDEHPDMRLWIVLSAQGNMHTYLSCDSTLSIQKTLGVPRDFAFGFLQESKRMTKNVFKLMEKTQEYEGKTKREHFRCGIEIEDHIPMWIPMPHCSCSGIERGFFECTCMCDRLKVSLREIFKRISHFGNENVFILFHIIMFESLREKLVDLWTRALREIKVGCRVEMPKLEHFSFTIDGDDSNQNCSAHDNRQVTMIHNRYFHGCEGKVLIVFPPLGGPQFQPHEEGSSLAMPFDNVIARTVSRLFIVTPTEKGMIKYSKELCKCVENERTRETNSAKKAKWDQFLSIFRHRENLPSYLMKMQKEGVLLKCPVGDVVVDESIPVIDNMQRLSITEAPITKWYMTPSQK